MKNLVQYHNPDTRGRYSRSTRGFGIITEKHFKATGSARFSRATPATAPSSKERKTRLGNYFCSIACRA
jgi:hypothetical protein